MYELTFNAAYNAWKDQVATSVNEESETHSENNSSSIIYNYIDITSEPTGSRKPQRPQSTEEISSNSNFTVQKNVAYD